MRALLADVSVGMAEFKKNRRQSPFLF